MRVIKIIFVVFILFTTTCAIAQTNTEQKKDVTTFLGIPVDGQKNEMIQKLKNKGFSYDAKHDRLKGEFNGKDVEISVVTNKGKVYRIVVDDANYTDEADIKIRFNNLCYQFENNPKYIKLSEDYTIGENENISYEVMVNKKKYQVAFSQVNKEYAIDIYERLNEVKNTSIDRIDTTSLTNSAIEGSVLLSSLLNKTVWFMINEYYGEYGIVIYYDNGYNKANGEDL